MAYLMKMHKKKGTWIGRYKVKIYDKPSTIDRYTICCDGGENGDRHVYGSSSNPFHPQGFGQYVGCLYFYEWESERKKYKQYGIYPGPHLGRVVAWDTLPDDVKRFVTQSLQESEDAMQK